MGLLTDFFSALNPATPEAGPGGTYPTASWKNVDTVKLATLENLVPGVDGEIALDRRMASDRGNFGDRGPWVHELSENPVPAPGRLDPKRTREIADACIATEACEADRGRGRGHRPLRGPADELLFPGPEGHGGPPGDVRMDLPVRP